MNAKNRYLKSVVLFLCTMLVLSLCACNSSRNHVHKSTRYQKVRTNHTPKRNATTSQNTTYYIKKHSTRKSHDGKTIKHKANKKNQRRPSKTSKR